MQSDNVIIFQALSSIALCFKGLFHSTAFNGQISMQAFSQHLKKKKPTLTMRSNSKTNVAEKKIKPSYLSEPD